MRNARNTILRCSFRQVHSAGSRRSSRGFTLIELLVVIAIISLLVAILLPSLSKAKELANTVVCSSQAKGLALGLMMYAQDDNGLLPNSHCWGVHWYTHLLDKYLNGNEEMFVCPSDRTIDRAIPIGWMNTSYGVNESGACPWGAWKRHNIAEIDEPSGRILLGESDQFQPDSWRTVISGLWDARYWPSDRHRGGSNVAFCDGHVAHLDWDGLMPPDISKLNHLWYLDQTPEPGGW